MNPDWTPPDYISPSQISSLLTCGEQYRLTRVEHSPERPMWAGIGGSAMHRLTEDLDLGIVWAADIDKLWPEYFQAELDEVLEKQPLYATTEYYVSGGKSRYRPNEDRKWWDRKGPEFVRSWVAWRDGIGYNLWTYPDGDGVVCPGVEVECWAAGLVRSIIDRVFVDHDDELRIVDLKSGYSTDAWPRQMALNNLCLSHAHGVRARWAGYWNARKGGVTEWYDLSRYTDEWLWEQVGIAWEMRERQLFAAQPNALCTTACGVAEWCVAVGGRPYVPVQDATLTHDESEQA